MHEAAIALSVLEMVVDKCREADGHAVSQIRVRIGFAAGVMPEALRFAFDAAKTAATVTEHADLVIERVPVSGVCRECKKEFSVQEPPYLFSCTLCNSKDVDITSGREMEVVDMVIDG